MADQLGRAVTYSTPLTATHQELLAALYAWFLAGNDPNWDVDATVTRPTQIAAAGDAGFALVNGAGDQILLADHAGVGGLCVDGGALGAADDLVVAVVPGGGTTDMTSGGFAAGARFSGWVVDVQGVANTSHAGRCKVSSGSDWLFIRFQTVTTQAYEGGFFAGVVDRADINIGAGWAIFGGLWADWATWSSSANDHSSHESYSGAWLPARVLPLDTNGLEGGHATDGGGGFRACPLAVGVPKNTVSTAVAEAVIIGSIPAVFVAGNGTLAAEWQDSGTNVIGYNMSGGCWIARDDGTDTEA